MFKTKQMNQLVSIAKFIIMTGITLACLTFIFKSVSYTTVSPDSLRFMHFWEVNYDKYAADAGGIIDNIKVIYHSLKDSSRYDLGRGRYMQYALYGFDVMLLKLFPDSAVNINITMILLMLLNSGLISYLAVSFIKDNKSKLDLFLLFFLILITSSIVISPMIVLVLYGKYIWVTFILLYFIIFPRKISYLFLILAAYSDEIGLLAGMAIIFFEIFRHLSFLDPYNGRLVILVKQVLLSCSFSIVSLFTVYGLPAVFFGTAPTHTLGFVHESLKTSTGFSDFFVKIFGILWCAELFILGFPVKHKVILALIGLCILALIFFGIWLNLKKIRNISFLTWLFSEKGKLYSFWIVMFAVLTIVILPGVGDIGHYSYPIYVVITILLLMTVVNIFRIRTTKILTLFILFIHIISFPKMIAYTSNRLEECLCDKTVSSQEINEILLAIKDIREKKDLKRFRNINNGNELDFSGTWFYSKVANYNKEYHSHYPVEGIVRVLSWPNTIAVKEEK